ncbi:MAG: hypothetical protein M3203_01255 [Actinomycetota bacterium]|nr:hypothetical protein [Actinomycetota bacterium]
MRDVEIGLTAISALLLGGTSLLFGLSLCLRRSARHIAEPMLMAPAAIFTVGGTAIALDGFSPLGMTATTIGGLFLAAGTAAASAQTRTEDNRQSDLPSRATAT